MEITFFVCDKDFNTENFPSIYFFHKELNHTFILTQKELFKIIGDKKYCLLVYDLYRPQYWMFGKIFLEKYSFNYDPENKRIGFYKKGINANQDYTLEEKKEQNILLINLICVEFLLLSLLLIFLFLCCINSKIELSINVDIKFNNE